MVNYIDQIINADSLQILPQIPDGVATLVITSPPYAAQKSYEKWADLDEYKKFAQDWVSLIPRLIKPTGSFWLNVGYTKTGNNTTLPLTYLYYPLVKMPMIQEIVWHYEGGMSYKQRFTHRHENWMWFSHDPNNVVFNLDAVRDPILNRTKDKRNNPLGKNPTSCWSYPKESLAFDFFSIQTHNVIIGIKEFENFSTFVSGIVNELKNTASRVLFGNIAPNPTVERQFISDFIKEVECSRPVQPYFWGNASNPYATITIEYSSNAIIIEFGRNRWIICCKGFIGNNPVFRQRQREIFAINSDYISACLFVIIGFSFKIPLPSDIINQLEIVRRKCSNPSSAPFMINASIGYHQPKDVSGMASDISKIALIEGILSLAVEDVRRILTISQDFSIMSKTISSGMCCESTVFDFTKHKIPIVNVNTNIININTNLLYGNLPSDFWYFDRVVGGNGKTKEKTSHPAQYPEKMIERIIKACTNEGDLVVDPFSGSGTTAVICKRLNRRYLVVEQNKEYYEESLTRVGETQVNPNGSEIEQMLLFEELEKIKRATKGKMPEQAKIDIFNEQGWGNFDDTQD